MPECAGICWQQPQAGRRCLPGSACWATRAAGHPGGVPGRSRHQAMPKTVGGSALVKADRWDAGGTVTQDADCFSGPFLHVRAGNGSPCLTSTRKPHLTQRTPRKARRTQRVGLHGGFSHRVSQDFSSVSAVALCSPGLNRLHLGFLGSILKRRISGHRARQTSAVCRASSPLHRR